MFVLWDDDAVRTWLAKEPTVPLRTDDDRLQRVIAECRADGYLVERQTAAGRRLYALTAGIPSTPPARVAGAARRDGVRHRRARLPAE